MSQFYNLLRSFDTYVHFQDQFIQQECAQYLSKEPKSIQDLIVKDLLWFYYRGEILKGFSISLDGVQF